jgi:hypothetical protein
VFFSMRRAHYAARPLDRSPRLGVHHAEHTMVRVVLEVEQPVEVVVEFIAVGDHLLHEGHGLRVVQSARPQAKAMAAGGIGRGDSGENGEGRRDAGEVDAGNLLRGERERLGTDPRFADGSATRRMTRTQRGVVDSGWGTATTVSPSIPVKSAGLQV